MNIDQLKKDLLNDEGIVLHSYKDSEGFDTIGIGRLIDRRKGGGITKDEAYYLLENDITRVKKQVAENIPLYFDLCDTRQRALCNMCFQLGIKGLLGFKKMLLAMARSDWQEAYNEALDSLWAAQTPVRAVRVATMILKGEDYVR